MFTGIVEGLRRVVSIEEGDGYRRFGIDLGPTSFRAVLGASIAVNGCCLTVEGTNGTVATFFAVSETLRKTTLGGLRVGDSVNVEPALRAGDDLGGHFVTGHVDGTAVVVEKQVSSGETWVTVAIPDELTAFVVSKGSITLDGVSLTVAACSGNRISVALIPHTLASTTLALRGVGTLVNVEMDTFGKWVSKLMKERLP